MLPSAGVQEPQRVFWFVTQRTDGGPGPAVEVLLGQPLAPARPVRASPSIRLLSWAASLSSITPTQRCSSASDIRAGISTMVRSPSR